MGQTGRTAVTQAFQRFATLAQPDGTRDNGAMLAGAFFSVLLMVAGTTIALRNLLPRRRGQTPHCRKCEYNLTGTDLLADRAVCSECGTEVSASRGVVLGERHIRRGWGAFGVALGAAGALASLAIAWGNVTHVRWDTLKPTWWLALELRTNAPADACRELTRRRLAGQLSAEQFNTWAEATLAAQAAPAKGRPAQAILDSLGELIAAGKLTPAQLDRFSRTVLRGATFSVRRRVLAGDPVPYKLSVEPVLPSGMGLNAQFEHFDVDGVLAYMGGPGFSVAGGSGHSSFPYRILGQHTVRAHLTTSILASMNSNTLAWWTGPTSFDADFEVLPAGSPDTVTLVRNAALDDWARQNITIGDLCCLRGAGWTARLEVRFARPSPVDFAFDVLFDDGAARIFVGHATCLKQPGSASVYRALLQGKLPEALRPSHIVLQPSLTAARQTVDIYETWGGGLRFEVGAVNESGSGAWTAPRTLEHPELIDDQATQPTPNP